MEDVIGMVFWILGAALLLAIVGIIATKIENKARRRRVEREYTVSEGGRVVARNSR